jgi:4-hydroxy-tetrahydrodipicolinate synthase
MTLNLRGLVPAVVTPFNSKLQVDEAALAGLIAHALRPPEAVAILVNGIAGEVDSLQLQERSRNIEVARFAAGERHVVAGIEAHTAVDARVQAESAAKAGADAVLLQAPAAFARGIAEAPDVAIAYVREVASGGVPIILFQHQFTSQRSYPLALLLRLMEIDGVAGVKETIWDVARYERTVTAIRHERPDAQVMLANDTLLLPCLVSAIPDGMMLGFASLAGQQIAGLWRAVFSGNLVEAMRIHREIAPLRDALYCPPALSYYPRLKAGLHLLGLLPTMEVRSPLVRCSAAELATMRDALTQSGLLPVRA